MAEVGDEFEDEGEEVYWGGAEEVGDSGGEGSE